MNFLEKMREVKAMNVRAAKLQRPHYVLRKKVKKAKHAFLKALQAAGKKKRVALIAEFKRASPSRGGINHEADLQTYIGAYDECADAVSVLTESQHFSGSVNDLREARRHTKLPILRKDFIIDGYQIHEARDAGADAVLLIAEMVGLDGIRVLMKEADALGMDCLVECFTEKGLHDVLASGAKIVGVNNRNLITMEEDSGRAARFAAMIPAGKRAGIALVAESSISSREQIDALQGVADAALVGTSLMSAPSPRAKLKELSGGTLVKICGATNVGDALDSVKLGADVVGLNFYGKSPRFVTVQCAREIADAVRGKAVVCGVFVDETAERVEMAAREAGLDMVQFSGGESPQYVNSFAIPAIKAVHVGEKDALRHLQDYDTPLIMLDSFSPGLYGGTGKRFDEGAVDFSALGGRKLVFSGGLNPANVKGIIRKFRPYMVDVCSGVESAPGKKSRAKMKAFLKNAEGARK